MSMAVTVTAVPPVYGPCDGCTLEICGPSYTYWLRMASVTPFTFSVTFTAPGSCAGGTAMQVYGSVHCTPVAATPPNQTPMGAPSAVGKGPPLMVTDVPPCIGPWPGLTVGVMADVYVYGVDVRGPPWLK